MNREIKFRVWHPVLKQMLPNIQNHIGNDSWAFGNLLKNGEVEVMQYTGLKDKNGVEIYEGDIIDYGCNRFKPVEFIDGCFCICKITAMPTLMTLYNVVGNIYETPELLQP